MIALDVFGPNPAPKTIFQLYGILSRFLLENQGFLLAKRVSLVEFELYTRFMSYICASGVIKKSQKPMTLYLCASANTKEACVWLIGHIAKYISLICPFVAYYNELSAL